MTQKAALLTLLGVGTVGSGVGGGIYYFSKGETIADKLSKENFALIKESEGYQVAFKELKGDTTFIDDIKPYGTNITAESELDKGGEALDKWCNAKVKESLSSEGINDLINKVKKYCKEQPLTIGGKLSGKLLTDGWKAKLASLKTSEETTNTKLLEDLKTMNEQLGDLNPSTDDKGEKALEGWCEKAAKTHLVEDKDNEIFKKVENRCTK